MFMLVVGRVVIKKVISFVPGCRESLFFLDEDDTMKNGDLFGASLVNLPFEAELFYNRIL